MKEELISLETAILAKEVGCDLTRCECGGFPECICEENDKIRITQSLLQKWLRDTHKIIALVTFNPDWDFGDDEDEDYKDITVFNNGYIGFFGFADGKSHKYDPELDFEKRDFETYEDALEWSLVESLKLLK